MKEKKKPAKAATRAGKEKCCSTSGKAATGLLYGPAAAFTRRKAVQYGKIGGRR